ncbi:MAG TPA: DUF72 domain-containing protein [Pyrinomonadaceae bacterium]|jgi:uncharacterized protein YecE (DUF72 family)|nr:DUF72 domain-containing protein [Pyrinomonadaceae bacterium]
MGDEGEARRAVKVGCCGFRLSRAEYFLRFPVVEVQQTFYQPPKVETLRRWREEAPEDFEFTIKAWQLITHDGASPTYRRMKRELTGDEREECGSFRPTGIVREGWEVTRACAEALGARRILFQCPARFKPTEGNVANLRRFFTSVERAPFVFLWEPRGGWPRELVRELCQELGLSHVVDPLVERTATPGRCYFRLHVRRGGRNRYEDEELSELYSMLPRGETSYVLFNNVRMADDATRFQRIIAGAIEDEA